ncbi:hypothetical protein JCM11251_007502 [Rhodosporidiobolus azoricus]
MDGRGAYLEAALENRRLQGVPVLQERQADEACGERRKRQQQYITSEAEEAFADAYAGEVGTWDEEENGRGGEEVLRERDSPPPPPPASTGGANLSRMTSTRRYMQELDPDDDADDDLEALREEEGEGNGDEDARSTWYSGYGSEARDSVASLMAPMGKVGFGPPQETRQSTMTVGSVNDPFGYSVYQSLPSPVDPAFPSFASESLPPSSRANTSAQPPHPPALPFHHVNTSPPSSPVLRIGPPSPTTEAYLANPHDSALWTKVVAAAGAPDDRLSHSVPPRAFLEPPAAPALSSSQPAGRVRSQTLSGKNFSRPFAPPLAQSPSPAQLSSPQSRTPYAYPLPASRSNSNDSYSPTSLGRQDSLVSAAGYGSSVERSSSLGHSSSIGHSSRGAHSMSSSWEDRQRSGFRQHEEAKRAIALARSKSQRAVAERHRQREEEEMDEHKVEELKGSEEDQRIVPILPAASRYDPPPSFPAHIATDSSSGSIHFAPSSPPAAPLSATTGHFSLSYYAADDQDDAHTSARQRNVLRKPRPPAPSTLTAAADASLGLGAPAMGRSLSGASTTSTGSTGSQGGVWSRLRARSKSRSGADQRPDPATLRPPLPAISAPLLVSDLPPAFSSAPPLNSSPFSSASSSCILPAPTPLLPPPSSAPLSQAEFARLAASRPAFPRSRTEENDWVLKSVAGAKTVQAGLVGETGVTPSVKGWGVEEGEDEAVEHLSVAGTPLRSRFAPPGMARSYSDTGPSSAPLSPPPSLGQHDRAPSAVPSLYSQYSYYELGPNSPLHTPHSAGSRQHSPLPSPEVAAVKFADAGGGKSRKGEKGLQRASSTMEKLGIGVKQERLGVAMERTPSGKEVRKEPVTADDFLQLGIDLHENGELERSAWCFEQSARRNGGCGAGMLMYGLTLRHGWGCQVNAQLGFRYLQMAAESVVEDLDRVVFGGRTLSEKEANTKSAKNELVLALYEMGISYRFGWGVTKDKKMAVSYLRLASELGDVDAQQEVAFMYANGKGVKKDLKSAAKFYRLAIKQGASDFGLSWVWKEKYDD